MHLPPYYLSRPRIELTAAIRDEFEALFSQVIREGSGNFIEYSCLAPKWQFLCYLGDSKEVVLHGSGDSAITEFEPRQSDSSEDFGNQEAIYASSDGLWANYFAVVDRPRYVWSLVNSCFRLTEPDGQIVPYYFFSINADALLNRPWRSGTVYVLPRERFEQKKSGRPDSESAHWRSFAPVKPLARISMEPADFPFLDQIRGHNVEVIQKRAQEDPDGFPWLDD